MDRKMYLESSSQGKSLVPSLQSLCLDALAVAIIEKQPGFNSDTLSTLPAEFSERLQHILIGKNALDDNSLVMTTSVRQTSLTIPFSVTDEDERLSMDSVLLAIAKCEHSLRSFSMAGHELTPVLLEKITSEPLKSNLESLSLVGCRVSLNDAQQLLTACTSLHHLVLSGNEEINDDLFVPVRAAGLRNGHVYATRSGATSVSSNLDSLPARAKSKRSRSSLNPPLETSHAISSYPNSPLEFDASQQMDQDWSKLSSSLISQSPSHLDFSTSDSSSSIAEETNLDSFQPASKRPCTHYTINDVPPRFSSTDATSSSGLLTLHLSGTNITNKSIEAVSKLYPNLVDLDVSHCPLVSDLTPLILRCPGLRSLNISGSPVQSHAERLLEHVNLKEVGEETWPFFRNLEHLLFSGSGRLDEGFVTWLEACGESLLELRMSNKTLPEDPTTQHIHARNARAQLASGLALSRDQIAHIPLFVRLLLPCSRLEVLDIHGMNVTSSAMKLLFESTQPAWTNTCQEFDVVNCDEINLDTLAIVFALPPSLNDPSQSMVILGSGMTWPNLKTLRFSGGRYSDTLAGPILPAIGMYACPQLEHLVLNNVRCGKALLRPVQLAQILQKFQFLRSLEVWCCSSISYSLASVITQLCKNITSVLLCVVGGGANAPPGAHHHPPHHHPAHHDRALPPNALAVIAAAESMTLPSFLSPEQVKQLQKLNPSIEWKLWRHSVDSPRQFQHIRPIHAATGEPISNLRPEQPANHLSVQIEATGATDVALPLRSRLIKASVMVDGIPIWGGEKSASMHQLTQSIWGLVTHNAGALPLVEDWCCACNIEEFNGVLFYDDAEYVYWDVLEPGPKAQFKFHKSQYVAAIAAAMQQQWNIFKGILPKEELVHQALLFTQQHAWHQKLLDRSNFSSMASPRAVATPSNATMVVGSKC